MRRRRWLVLLLALVAVLLTLQGRAATTSALSNKPNIIVIITDDQDVDSTAIMRKLMANPYGKWFQFTDALASDSIGGVARVSLLTGQHSRHHKVFSNQNAGRLDDRNTLATWLQAQGYYTALIGKYLNGYPWDKGVNYKPAGWNHFSHLGHKDVDRYSDDTVSLLNTVIDTTDAPFFLYLAHRAPQRPAEPPPRYENENVFSIVPPANTRPNFAEVDMSDKPKWASSQPMPKPGGYPDQMINGYPGYMWDTNWIIDEHRRALQQTMAIDDSIQVLLDLLDEKGELDDTIIFYTADSGYSWGAHRRTGRGCPYEECSGIPFLVFYPDALVPSGARPYEVNRVVSNIDITATIVDVANLTPRRSPQDGTSLMPLLNSPNPNSATWTDAILLENLRGPIYTGVRTQDWKYVEYSTGEKELYDLVNDPYEMQNVVSVSAYSATRVEMARKLAAVQGSVLTTIAGRVVNPSGNGIPNVLISDGAGSSTTTGADGTYVLTSTKTGTKKLTVSKLGYTFNPATRTVVLPPDLSGVNFVGTPKQTFTVSGIIRRDGKPLAGVSVSNGAGRTVVTDAKGKYNFGALPAGNYTITAAKTGLAFAPGNWLIEVPPGSTTLHFAAATAPTYTISGVVRDDLGFPLSGVSLSAGAGRTTTTDNTGRYSFTNVPEGSYSISGTKVGYSINPISVAIPPASNAADLTAQTLYYSISGTITGAGSTPIEGVLVQVPQGNAAYTDASGAYTITGLKIGSYTLTASKQGFTFTPATRTVTLSGSNSIGNNYSGTLQTYSISGRIVDGSGNGVSGIVVSDGNGRTTTTNSTGNYTFSGLLPGSYTLTATRNGYRINPGSIPVTLGYQNVTGNDFSAELIVFDVSGSVLDSDGLPMSGVAVSNGTGSSTVTDGNGNYTISLTPGDHDLTASKSGYGFDPAPAAVTVADADIEDGPDFVGTMSRYTISGVIKLGTTPLAGVTVAYGPGQSVVTDAEGRYTIPSIVPGTYILTPYLQDHTFTPVSTQVQLYYEDATNQNFAATLQTYSVAGVVLDTAGNPIKDVVISDGNGRSTTTSVSGTYTLSGLPRNTYTLSATKAGYIFNTLSSVSVPPNVTGHNFIGTLIVHDISGVVTDAANNPLPGVTITYATGKSVLTGSDGTFLIKSIVPGTYTLTPTRPGYSFQPSSRQVLLNSDVTDVAFVATELRYTISGVVKTASNAPLKDVVISYGANMTVTTNALGQYTIADLVNGSYTLTPYLADHTFSPTTQVIDLNYQNATRDFTGTLLTYSISGVVRDSKGAVLSGVTITDGNGRSTTSAVLTGAYTLSNLPRGTYTLTASRAGYTFDTLSAVTVPANVTGHNFTGTLIVWDISGTILDQDSNPLPGVTITYATGKTVQTNAQGQYRIDDIVPGTYTLTPSLPGYSFNPSNRVLTLNADTPGMDFAATQLKYSISGFVRTPSNVAVPGVVITTDTGVSATTGADGSYRIDNLLNGTYTLTPSLEEYTFTPSTLTVALNYQNQTARNFTANQITYPVTGKVVDALGLNMSGVTISAGPGRTTTTALDGTYTLNLPKGTYTLTATRAGYSMTTRGAITVPPGVSGQDFVGTLIVYNISGTINDTSGAPMSGVTISYASGKSVSTDANGQFLITDIPGTYTLTPSLQGYSFNPAAPVVNTLSGSVSGVNITATRLTYLIRGIVQTSTGLKVPNVTITYGPSLTTTTDAAGIYTITGLYPGNYTLVPSLHDYTFSPSSLNVVLGFDNSTTNNFTVPMYAVSGEVRDQANALLTSVEISTVAGWKTTTNTGQYTVYLPAGTHTLTATKAGYGFNAIGPITVPPGLTNQNFTGTKVTYSISGTIRNANGRGVPGIQVAYGNNRAVTTDMAGNYVISGLDPGTYTIKPVFLGFTFNPVRYYPVTITTANIVGRDFTATGATRSISGTIVNSAGSPLANVAVVYGPGLGDVAYTNAFGQYATPGLLPGAYVLTPSLAGYSFSPTSASIALLSANVTQNFIGSQP